MKLVCSTEKLKTALTHADRVTGKNLTLPILSTVLCIATNTSLKIRATNLSLGIEIEIPAQVEKEGVVAISGALLSNFLNTLKTGDQISLEQVNETLLVKTKQGKVIIKTFSYEDFPTIPIVEAEKIQVQATQFLEGIESVYYASAQTDIKPEVASVFIYPGEDTLTFVSTDSFRLAEKKIKTKNIYGFQPVLIPTKNIIELIRILADVKGDLDMCITKNQLSISFGGYYITSRLVDGSFPDYKQIIPKESTTEIVLLKNELQNAIKSSTLFTDKFNQVTFSILVSEKKCLVSSKSSETGENEIQIDGALSGKDISLNINYRYLLDCLQIISTDSVIISCTTPTKPLVIKGVSDNSFLYLIMPMNR